MYGKVLKGFREKAGMTQEQLAEKLNRSRSCISKMESDRKQIDLATAIHWAQVTGCELAAATTFFGLNLMELAAQAIQLMPAYIQAIDIKQLFIH